MPVISRKRGLLLALALLVWSPQLAQAQQPDLAITGVTLIDGTGAPPQEGVTILVQDGLVANVTPADEAVIPDGATVIDAAGKYAIPGLADMHVHFGRGGSLPNNPPSVERALRQYLYYGVTTVLNVGAYSGLASEILDLWRQQAEGTILAPHIYATGGLLTVPGAHPVGQWARRLPEGVDTTDYDWTHRGVWVVRTPAEVRRVVRRMAAASMDGIKVVIESDSLAPPYPQGLLMPLEMVEAAVAEGHEHDLPVYAHATQTHEAEVAVEADVHAIAHLPHVPEHRRADLFAEMRRRDIYVVTTLTTYIMPGTWGDPSDWLTDPFLSGVERRLIDTLGADPLVPPVDDSGWTYRRGVLQTLRDAHDAGVKLVCGTDPPTPYVFHGYSVHQELELMVEAGLTPTEALVIATRRPAEMLGEEEVFGTIEPGRRADLLLLFADPLEDIRNTRTLETVIRSGEVIERTTLLTDE